MKRNLLPVGLLAIAIAVLVAWQSRTSSDDPVPTRDDGRLKDTPSRAPGPTGEDERLIDSIFAATDPDEQADAVARSFGHSSWAEYSDSVPDPVTPPVKMLGE